VVREADKSSQRGDWVRMTVCATSLAMIE
jgi:hypothetical protein